MYFFTFKKYVVIFFLINVIQLSYTDNNGEQSLSLDANNNLLPLGDSLSETHKIEKRQIRRSANNRRFVQQQRRRQQQIRHRQMMQAIVSLQQQVNVLQSVIQSIITTRKPTTKKDSSESNESNESSESTEENSREFS